MASTTPTPATPAKKTAKQLAAAHNDIIRKELEQLRSDAITMMERYHKLGSQKKMTETNEEETLTITPIYMRNMRSKWNKDFQAAIKKVGTLPPKASSDKVTGDGSTFQINSFDYPLLAQPDMHKFLKALTLGDAKATVGEDEVSVKDLACLDTGIVTATSLKMLVRLYCLVNGARDLSRSNKEAKAKAAKENKPYVPDGSMGSTPAFSAVFASNLDRIKEIGFDPEDFAVINLSKLVPYITYNSADKATANGLAPLSATDAARVANLDKADREAYAAAVRKLLDAGREDLGVFADAAKEAGLSGTAVDVRVAVDRDALIVRALKGVIDPPKPKAPPKPRGKGKKAVDADGDAEADADADADQGEGEGDDAEVEETAVEPEPEPAPAPKPAPAPVKAAGATKRGAAAATTKPAGTTTRVVRGGAKK